MNRFPATVLSMLLLLASSGCSREVGGDKVTMVDEDDPEMAAAIAKARSTLPRFWEVLGKPEHGEGSFSLKVRITDRHGTEHFWITRIERRDGTTTGTVGNEPNIVESVRMGQRIPIPEADISDWLYMRDGKMHGNETLRPLLKRMPEGEARRFRDMMAEP